FHLGAGRAAIRRARDTNWHSCPALVRPAAPALTPPPGSPPNRPSLLVFGPHAGLNSATRDVAGFAHAFTGSLSTAATHAREAVEVLIARSVRRIEIVATIHRAVAPPLTKSLEWWGQGSSRDCRHNSPSPGPTTQGIACLRSRTPRRNSFLAS